jgi:peptide/nickel transport system substrate-binding protein
MQRFIFRFLAIASLLIAFQSHVLGRPRYGGVLRIEIHETLGNLDPADWAANGAESAKEKLIPLIFERLVRLDENNRPQPALAVSWQHDSKNRRWRFRIRPDVRFHDGSPLTADIAAAALRGSAANWKPGAQGDTLIIDSDIPAPDLLFDLAQTTHSIYLRGADQKTYGTGPFQLTGWDAGRRAVLAANEQYWAGRPFLDGLAVLMGKSLSDQMLDLELGKADFIEVWPNEMRRLPKETRTWSTPAHILIALAFERGRPACEDARLREALALSIDRASINNWLLQKQGETTAALLPQKISGYAFLFSSKVDLKKARQLASRPGQPASLSLAYDAFDPFARSVAERISVNAREAGITVNVAGRQANSDIRLLRLPIRTSIPDSALESLLASLHLTEDANLSDTSSSIEAIYAAENSALSTYRVIPLFHVPEIFGSSTRLKSWVTTGVDQFGEWHFDDMWLDMEKP